MPGATLAKPTHKRSLPTVLRSTAAIRVMPAVWAVSADSSPARTTRTSAIGLHRRRGRRHPEDHAVWFLQLLIREERTAGRFFIDEAGNFGPQRIGIAPEDELVDARYLPLLAQPCKELIHVGCAPFAVLRLEPAS